MGKAFPKINNIVMFYVFYLKKRYDTIDIMNSVYADYLYTIGEKFTSLLGEIRADYNFDLGDEFEIAICKALRVILPTKYGICRGTVFTIDNKSIGDDIIIFDQWKFPVLRLLDDNNYAQKQRIPIEAVLAYIEAKNTIVLENGHGNSLKKALEQATAIKKIGRKEMRLNPFYFETADETLDIIKATRGENYPKIDNPLYTCIFTRGVRLKYNTELLDAKEIDDNLTGKDLSSSGRCVDLLVLHKDIVLFPIVNSYFSSPFWLNGKSTNYRIYNRENLAWGIGVSLLLFAFDFIRLGSMDWRRIIGQTLNMAPYD
ncbi:DUF6602 domain-containing protein [Treponema sp. R8-4-B8]